MYGCGVVRERRDGNEVRQNQGTKRRTGGDRARTKKLKALRRRRRMKTETAYCIASNVFVGRHAAFRQHATQKRATRVKMLLLLLLSVVLRRRQALDCQPRERQGGKHDGARGRRENKVKTKKTTRMKTRLQRWGWMEMGSESSAVRAMSRVEPPFSPFCCSTELIILQLPYFSLSSTDQSPLPPFLFPALG